jgi:transcriptional regulator with XRE-family HTH domain
MTRPFAIRIREARAKAGLTQHQAAAATGYSHSAIQKFERGVRVPPIRSQVPILTSIRRHG